MEKGINYLRILTVFVIDLFWLVIGATKKVLSHWNIQLLDCFRTAGVRKKASGHNRTGEKAANHHIERANY